ncbi:MAG: hypothetical protein GW772_10745 [Flavobacteriia bacterium]|nr:hypothetical protein [Flavobacteriia bacterium]NCT61026.1 hypothetical protein [Flavobacteriia bacterium]PIV96237.1 MAG: hypothetical protein COW43_09335 [Flavobacteriaceae bacterium CG17_big_fil_post_rev_8_21_14_2_50_31_13]PIX12584.1 MAG: hypothetical protein COZ74_10745 [Flavobacteriaceae bacterium CG_4_8_14_3_um_filter_31_8]
MKNLQSFGVQELDAKEVRETEGGIPWLGAFLAWYVYETLDNTDASREAMASGAKAAMSLYK